MLILLYLKRRKKLNKSRLNQHQAVRKLKRQEKSRIHPESSLAFTKEFQPSIGRENASKIAQKITALMRNPIHAG